jgi:nucleotide-binding universal stress UspA family protein
MKTILVLTDFTIKADHAAHYALKLAQKIEADILLCNVYPEGNVKPVFTHAFWPGERIDSMEEDSKNDLNELAGRLTAQMISANVDKFKPCIELCARPGRLIEVINDIVKHRQILMAVIATHSTDDYLTFLTGNHANEIIENATCPVLVLPYQAVYTEFKKIAFATDLVNKGGDMLHTLYRITRHFDPEILITHVADGYSEKVVEEKINEHFFDQEIIRPVYPKIHYLSVQNKNVAAGLDWVAQHTDIDLMVLVHRKRNFFQKMFDVGTTQKLTAHFAKPMLVFPTSHVRESLPVF